MAENLAEMGVSVTIVQRPKQLLAPLDADMASFVHAEMRRHGVALRLGETVTGFRQDGDSVLTLLEESEPLHSDMVLLAIGVTPDTHLAKKPDSGLVFVAASLSTSGWKPPCRTSMLWRCRRGYPFRDRAESVDFAGGTRQQAGTHCR